jgi:ketosteroid isomerase-like protein
MQAVKEDTVQVTSENVEIVRRAFAEVNARLEFSRELIHPDCELDLTDSGGPVAQGLDAAEETMQEYWEMFEDFHYEIEEVLHADEEHVVVSVRDGGRMKGSGAEVWTRFFDVVTFRGGKIVRLSAHLDRNRALKAAGVSE